MFLLFFHLDGPFVGGGEGLRGLYPDGGVPFSGRKHDHLVQELVDAGQQVLSVLGLVRDVVEDLSGQRGTRRSGARGGGGDLDKEPAVPPGSKVSTQT